ncbi:MAG: ribosome biogenesis GTPase Der [Candidatus Doudnabacteria bacterium RIFCSPLOWO2_02_FULL_49_13]|uniref:GTPase Der n=1 Tax=Candidatus Doudnabacteria bacterium RIFCSPHIGHO2_12_FULL_48_16 TaxID=1817838 RepID=A0A1F5PKL1_9BACT|nr:MAG: ribosome biogenesis GTPase Der [Candidatus Doudnabacteria bacterium RIFCSPHIGHO2_02_FULL_49_24]OGE89940.1 MAG: ribosome biogenesis GTPase Der [Candidatus Doudnabacteria bacterium RIFCSPHIGHO2_01_FULL_50_67]OGE90202.1 MAG: ribosome biogenesis GTPase Der [Candidatus Doudnabacteria bacterium RIFCSPHIGHO2_12_FULL_48_16]OGE97743.1 MAG: ribosome biogenesis GTPase Der [Candidatus Doudnabacteria bacterium RIFCSPLOWO2_01_FULL_49_40]OGF03345.1 MAG: ribosome biogenesis GTPase Der [Candidatus Doudn
MRIPLVAIIGSPNSGKSTFFNKVLEERKALTYPEAGTTRDRAYGLAAWNGLSFYLIDTAGIIGNPDSDLEKNVQKQTQIARDEADLILYIVDGQTPVGSEDLRVAAQLKQTKKPIVLAVNKIDTRNAKTETAASGYLKLGLGETYAMSSINGAGIGDLLDAVVAELKKQFDAADKNQEEGLRIAFVGKPNVGKSSLINALLKQERLITSPIAGTTRSTVEVPFEHGGQKFILLDTAGIKKKWNQDSDVAAAAAMQSIRTISQADVIFFTVDASQELSVQDQIIAEQILDAQKSCVVALNKIDLLAPNDQQRLLDTLPDYLPQMWYLPVLFISAKTSQGLDLLLKFAIEAHRAARREIDPDELDAFLEKITKESMPGKMEDQRAPKIYNLKQIGTAPPTFKMTVNFPAAIATAWKRWFEKQFRLKFGLEGTPIEIRYTKKN